MYIPLTNVSAAMALLQACEDWDIIDQTNWKGYYGADTANEDSQVVFRDTGGRVAGRIMPTGEAVLKHKVQITIQSNIYSGGYRKGKQIENALLLGIRNKVVTVLVNEGTANETGVDVELEAFTLTTPLTALGSSGENDRTRLFTLNGLLTAREIH